MEFLMTCPAKSTWNKQNNVVTSVSQQTIKTKYCHVLFGTQNPEIICFQDLKLFLPLLALNVCDLKHILKYMRFCCSMKLKIA